MKRVRPSFLGTLLFVLSRREQACYSVINQVIYHVNAGRLSGSESLVYNNIDMLFSIKDRDVLA